MREASSKSRSLWISAVVTGCESSQLDKHVDKPEKKALTAMIDMSGAMMITSNLDGGPTIILLQLPQGACRIREPMAVTLASKFYSTRTADERTEL